MKFDNMYLRIYFHLLIVPILLISGCAPQIESVKEPLATAMPTLALPVATSTPNSIIDIVPSPTHPLSSIPIEKNCLSLEENLPTNLNLTGVWVRQDSSPFLENLDESTRYRVPLNGGGFLNTYEGHWSISPNGEWLAYLDTIIDSSNPRRIARTEGYSLRVVHSSGHSLSMDYWPMSFQNIQGWIDNENLLIRLDGRFRYLEDDRIIVLNPFSGKWHEVEKPEWFDAMNLDNSWKRYINKYSPNLSQTIVSLETHYELRDVNSGEVILKGNTKYGGLPENAWSPNGIMLAMTTNDGSLLHIFDGNEELLAINLLQSGLTTSSYIRSMKWSLNNAKLTVETFDELLVLDVNDRKINDICFSDTRLNRAWRTQSFFYPEDGQYIITSLYLMDENFHTEYFDVLVDLTNMRAYKLDTPKYKERIGWLTLP